MYIIWLIKYFHIEIKLVCTLWGKNKKLLWLQACFLGDVRVIWCNSLGDSLFQTYMMNFVKIVIDHYLLITSHVSQAITSCTHYISYSLLNLVHDIACNLVVAIQDYIFLDFNAKCVYCLCFFEDILTEKLVFGRSGLNPSVFEKLLISYSCILFIKHCVLRSFCIKLLSFSKFWVFQIFNWSKLFLDRSKMR